MTQVLTRLPLRELCRQRAVVVLTPEISVTEAAQRMQQARQGAVLIVAEGRLQGIFTERDLVNRVVAAGRSPQATPIGEVMTRDLCSAHPDDNHWMALSQMNRMQVRHLPVLENGEIVGMVSRRQLLALDNQTMEADLAQREASRLFI